MKWLTIGKSKGAKIARRVRTDVSTGLTSGAARKRRGRGKAKPRSVSRRSRR